VQKFSFKKENESPFSKIKEKTKELNHLIQLNKLWKRKRKIWSSLLISWTQLN